MELKLKDDPNLWLECLEQTLGQTLVFCTTVIVLKTDFDKSVIKIFMSENQNHWMISVFEIETTGDSWFETLEDSLDRKKFAHKRKFLWQIVGFVLCIKRLTVQILQKSITLLITTFNLTFLRIYGFGFFHGSFYGTRTLWRMLQNQFSSLRRRSRKSRKSKKCFRFWFISTLKFKFSRSTDLVPPMKVSIKKVKLLRVKDFVGEKNLRLFIHQNSDNSRILRLAKKMVHLHLQTHLFPWVVAWFL